MVLVAMAAWAFAWPLACAAQDGGEESAYLVESLPIPSAAYLEAGALEFLPGGDLAVATRRGEIWRFSNPTGELARIEAHRYAHGLHEVLGLAQRGDWLYCVQRGEVSRIKDTDADGRADLFETVSDAWGVTGDYHEYAFGSKFDAEGNLWVVLCLTGSFTSEAPFRGWCLRIDEQGNTIPTASGIRSPGGIGMSCQGQIFYTDNQGPWNGACSLKHLRPGSFQGHPAGNRWYELAPNLTRPLEPRSGSRVVEEAARIPQFVPPAVVFPYNKMGQSAGGIVCDNSGGAFGPFAGQLFVTDQAHSTVMRVFLEEVEGVQQGACFMFREGFASGALSLLMHPSGVMFVGGTDRGWGSRGGKPFSLQRVRWTGKTPFEVREMRAHPDGFELSFTQPVDNVVAEQVAAYQLQAYTYIYQEQYGSPEVDHRRPEIRRAVVSDDRLRVRLEIAGLVQGHIHELHMPGVRSDQGAPLVHDVAYYTLNVIPGER